MNPDNSAFQFALNSRIYVDKTDLISMHDGERDEEMSCQWLTIGSISAIYETYIWEKSLTVRLFNFPVWQYDRNDIQKNMTY
mgnify:FL=1